MSDIHLGVIAFVRCRTLIDKDALAKKMAGLASESAEVRCAFISCGTDGSVDGFCDSPLMLPEEVCK